MKLVLRKQTSLNCGIFYKTIGPDQINLFSHERQKQKQKQEKAKAKAK